ncbi:MAG TPA: photoactive yellow protein [Telluria sp.]
MNYERIKFEQDDIANVLSTLSEEQIDNLAFGMITLDRNGTILQYNAAEGAITGRDPKEAVGRNFFDEVAPCTKTPEFHGRFVNGARSGDLNVFFEYTFDYNMTPTRVRVHMKNAPGSTDKFWVLVKRL